MKKYRKTGILALLAALGLALAGCAVEEAAPQTDTVAPTLSVYTVSFYSRGQMVYQEQVEAGESPERMPTIATPAYVADAWVDAQGNEVDPGNAPVYADTDYTVVEYPALSNFVPYLFTDADGFLRPDDSLTGGELKEALYALAYDTAALEDISLPEEDVAVTKDALGTLLGELFPAEKYENALYNLPEGAVTRAAFAQLMNAALGRYGTDKVVMTQDQTLPRDLDLNRADAEAVLAAAMGYEVVETGEHIVQAALDMPWEPGFTVLDGWLYYADENGTLLRGGQVGTLTFGADGRYTSGDAQLDNIVAELLAGFIRENPQGESMDILYDVFLYCRDNFRYVNRGLLEAGETGWETAMALQMFETGAGNCYGYAAIFWALARGLGYDAYCVSGWTAEEFDPHGWVEIQLEDGLYIFDTELAMAYLRDGKKNYESLFKMPYALAVQWPYYWP